MHTEGTRVVGDDGHPVTLRGATVVRWVWALQRMELDWLIMDRLTRPINRGGLGANAGTLWVDTDVVEDGSYFVYADRMVDIVRANHAWLFLAWHAHHGPNTPHPSRIDDAGIAAMARLAHRYRDVPNVLYVTQVEPGDGPPDHHTISWPELKVWQERTIDAIREVHPDSLIGVSGCDWSQDFDGYLRDPIRRRNVVPQVHLYRHGIDSLAELLQARRVSDLAVKHPTLIGEFGDDEWPPELIRWADDHGLAGWQSWNCSDIGSPTMLDDVATFALNGYGLEVGDALRPTSRPGPPPIAVPLRINCGGTEYEQWLGDQEWTPEASWGWSYDWRVPFTGEARHDIAIEDPELYATERYGLGTYHILLEPDVYDVRLHFAETYAGTRQLDGRVFDVLAQRMPQIQLLDIYAQAGFARPYTREFHKVKVVDGRLDIGFWAHRDVPALKAIEVFRGGAIPTLERRVEELERRQRVLEGGRRGDGHE